MSTGCKKTTACQVIPTTRRVTINDGDHMPHDYSTTPGGTLFSTTPGGTRIIYDRSFLLECRSSPVAQAPPHYLPDIPGVTSPSKRRVSDPTQNGEPNNNIITDKTDDDQFEMDI